MERTNITFLSLDEIVFSTKKITSKPKLSEPVQQTPTDQVKVKPKMDNAIKENTSKTVTLANQKLDKPKNIIKETPSNQVTNVIQKLDKTDNVLKEASATAVTKTSTTVENPSKDENSKSMLNILKIFSNISDI